MIMVEGNSKPQNQAIALSIEVCTSNSAPDNFQSPSAHFPQEDVKLDFGGKLPISKEGSAASGWILLDYG